MFFYFSNCTLSKDYEREEIMIMFADEILGDFEKRYFGAGHKCTNL